MVTAARAYTPAEAAALSEIAVKSVHNAIDQRIIEAHFGREGRELSDEDLLRLKLWYGVGSILSAERRKRLFDTIDQNPDAETVRADEYLIVDVARAREQLAARAEALREAEQKIQAVKGVAGGEPVFTGTRVPVRMIAANCKAPAPRKSSRAILLSQRAWWNSPKSGLQLTPLEGGRKSCRNRA